ncbi:hypothetical protein [Halocola ammonii]
MKFKHEIILFAISLLLSCTVAGQSCEEFLQSKIDSSPGEFVDQLKKQLECGTLDEFDLEYCVPYWGEMYASSDSTATYNDFYTRFDEFKKTEVYKSYRAEASPQYEIQNLEITDSHWQKAKSVLEKSDVSKENITLFKNYIANHPEHKTYGEAAKAFWKDVKQK